MLNICKSDKKYEKIFLLIFLMFTEFIFHFYIKPVEMYFLINDLKYITTNVSTMKEIFMAIIYILMFSLFYSIAIISYKVIIKEEKYSIEEIVRKSISNFTVFLSVRLLLILTIDTIYSFLEFRIISYNGYLEYSIAVMIDIVFYTTSFSLFVFISLDLLNWGKKYLNTKYNFTKIKTFIFSKTLLKIFLLTLIFHLPYIIYYQIFLSPDISGVLNNNENPMGILMKILHIHQNQRVDILYLLLVFSGRALARFFMLVKVYGFIDKTQEVK